MTKEEYKALDGFNRKTIVEAKKDKKYKPTITDIDFPLETLQKSLGKGYTNLHYKDIFMKIYYSAKGTKKSFNLAQYILWFMCNFKEANVLAMRNTISTIYKTLVKTFISAIRHLIKNYNITGLEYLLKDGNHSKSNMEKKFQFPWGTVILFAAFEQADGIAGTYAEVGSFEIIMLDEPIAKNVSEKIDYDKQQDDFKMIYQSLFRGKSKSVGYHNVLWKIVDGQKIYMPYKFDKTILLSMNPWDEKHWLSLIANEMISDNQWRDFVYEDIYNNYKMERFKDKVVVNNDVEYKQRTMVVKMTKFINEFVDEQEKANDMIMLSSSEPYDLTATLGFVYDGSDPSVYVYRMAMRSALSFENSFDDVYDYYTIGYDYGWKDKTSFKLKGWIMEEDGVLRDYYLKSYTFKQSDKKDDKKIYKSRLEINAMLIEWVEQCLLEREDLADKMVYCVCDEKGAVAFEQLAIDLQEAGYNNFVLYTSVKVGIPIVSRQHITQVRWELGMSLINWDEHPELYKEYWEIMYKDGDVIRDEKKFAVDEINSDEYANEPSINYMDLSMLKDLKIGWNSTKKYVI